MTDRIQVGTMLIENGTRMPGHSWSAQTRIQNDGHASFAPLALS